MYKLAKCSVFLTLCMIPVALTFIIMSLRLYFSEEAYYCTGTYASSAVQELPADKAELYAVNGFLGIKQFWLSYLCLIPIIICLTMFIVPCLTSMCDSCGGRSRDEDDKYKDEDMPDWMKDAEKEEEEKAEEGGYFEVEKVADVPADTYQA